MRRLRIAALAVLAVAPAACDPCFGIALCNVAPRVVVSGRLLNDTTGRPEGGATIDMVRDSGVSTSRDSIRAVTDADGLFLLDVEASEVGEITTHFVVRPRSGPGYRAFGVRVTTTTRGGEAYALPPWSTIPHLPDYGEVFRRGGANETLPLVDVEFRRTGGVAFKNNPSGMFSSRTGATGLVPLMGDAVLPADAGDMVGDLTIFLPAPLGPSVHRGYRIAATPEYRRAARIRRVGAGPSLNYLFQARRRARPDIVVPGVTIYFTQRSGPPIDPSSWVVTVNASGDAFFPGRALDTGMVVGDLNVNVPAPFKSYSRPAQQFPTFDTDSITVAPLIGVGPWFPHYVIIRANGTLLKGARVDVQRRSGIAVTPALFSAVTNDSGIVKLQSEPAGEGEIIADITVTPPAPYSPFTLRNERLVAIEADVPGGRTLLGDWDVTRPPASAYRRP